MTKEEREFKRKTKRFINSLIFSSRDYAGFNWYSKLDASKKCLVDKVIDEKIKYYSPKKRRKYG